MLLALWPAIIARSQWISAGRGHETVTQRAIHAKDITKRKAAIRTTIAQRRLPEVDDGTSIAGNADQRLVVGSIPDSNQPLGNATIRIPRHERELSGRIPEALGTSLAAGDAIPFDRINSAVIKYANKQREDDDDMAIIALILAGDML